MWVTVEGFGGVLKEHVQRDVPGMLYQPGGEGGRGLSPRVSTLMMFVKPTAGFAGMLIGKACGMRAVRPRRKKSVEDITVDGKREFCRVTQVRKARREANSKNGTHKELVEKVGVDKK